MTPKAAGTVMPHQKRIFLTVAMLTLEDSPLALALSSIILFILEYLKMSSSA